MLSIIELSCDTWAIFDDDDGSVTFQEPDLRNLTINPSLP